MLNTVLARVFDKPGFLYLPLNTIRPCQTHDNPSIGGTYIIVLNGLNHYVLKFLVTSQHRKVSVPLISKQESGSQITIIEGLYKVYENIVT